MTTEKSCMKEDGRFSEWLTSMNCGKRSMMSGPRGPQRSCPSGSVSDLVRRLVIQKALRMVKREKVWLLQRKRRKKKKSKHCFSANKNSLIFAINSRHPVITSDCQPTHSGRECFKFVQTPQTLSTCI